MLYKVEKKSLVQFFILCFIKQRQKFHIYLIGKLREKKSNKIKIKQTLSEKKKLLRCGISKF